MDKEDKKEYVKPSITFIPVQEDYSLLMSGNDFNNTVSVSDEEMEEGSDFD